jgi:hypothetical protein
MPRPLSAAREREFQELYAFVDFYSTQVTKPVANSPKMADVCIDIIEKYGRSKALEGLRMATNDILEELGRIPSEQVESLDEAFRRVGLVSLSELRRRYSSSFKRIVKRGHIKDDTEYYLLNGVVVDQSNDIDATERALLQRLLDTYEQAVTPKS